MLHAGSSEEELSREVPPSYDRDPAHSRPSGTIGPQSCIVCGGKSHRHLFEKGGLHYWRCDACRLEVTWPLPTQHDLERYYEAAYAMGPYRPFVETPGMLLRRAQARLAQIRRFVRSGNWLDVGCSTGDLVEVAGAVPGVRAVGIELAESAVASARAAGRNVIRSSIEDVQLNEKFDTITAFDVIEHVIDPRAFLRRVRELAKPGSVVIVTTPNTHAWSRRLLRWGWYFYIPGEHLHHFNSANLIELLTSEGFSVTTARSIGKHVSFEYALAQFGDTSPGLLRLFRRLRRFIPSSLRTLLIPVRLGEILIVASTRAPAS